MESIDLELDSRRGTKIPCTITLPDVQEKMPLLLMAHGFCATRDENGTYSMLAEKCSNAGIATIRCDFPGCNNSKENHQFNNLENDMDDLDTLLAYMKSHYNIDSSRLAMIGYSMGGKVVLHFTKRHPEIQVMGLWAPAAMNGLTETGGALGDEALLKNWMAIAKKDGFYLYDNPFDERMIPLGYEFFKQCLESKANDYFSAYKGAVIMVNGDKDDTIFPETLQKVADTVNSEAHFVHHIVKGANHGFGAWTNEPHQMKELVNVTSEFIIQNLNMKNGGLK